MLKFIPFIKQSNQSKNKTKPPRKRRLALEALENRELLSVTPYSVGYDESPIVLVTHLDNTTAEVSVANTADIILANAPAGYNAHDWDKVEAAKANNGLKDEHVTWTVVNGEMRITRIEAWNAGLIGSLDLSGCAALTILHCGENQLKSLNVTDCTALGELLVLHNQLTSLDVSSCTALTWQGCADNQLTSLNVSNNMNLSRLGCNGNNLTSLDVSKNTALWDLWCQNNQLTSLDVSMNTALTNLYCDNNRLTFSSLSARLHDYSSNYTYSPQNTVSISLSSDKVVNLSSEYLGGTTTYRWYYSNGTQVNSSLYTAANGVFTFTGLQNGAVIYCTMTNAGFTGLTLQTTQVMIGVSPPVGYNDHDWNKVEIAKAINGLKDEHVTWAVAEKLLQIVIRRIVKCQ